MIGIINYRAGNLHNLKNALDKIGVESQIFDSAAGLEDAQKIILPGVGSFGYCAQNLSRYGFVEPILKAVNNNTPMLGICVGMQLLFEDSEENPEVKGLGLVRGHVKKFSNDLKVPQIGWNSIRFEQDPIFDGVNQNSWYYFVHSYYCEPQNASSTLGATNYGVDFCGVVKQNNLYGFQFHPEKSHDNGLLLLKNFCLL